MTCTIVIELSESVVVFYIVFINSVLELGQVTIFLVTVCFIFFLRVFFERTETCMSLATQKRYYSVLRKMVSKISFSDPSHTCLHFPHEKTISSKTHYSTGFALHGSHGNALSLSLSLSLSAFLSCLTNVLFLWSC